jgi:aspartyl-tRNA(Asn)/glutamyl-tRNA(Gln) amidotransferase subunit B
VNISIREKGAEKFGTKVEIKNLNSFRVVERSIDHEIKRQTEVLEKGEKVIQETRGWDDARGITFSQRIKEEAHDYRYFPEPDLPPLNGLLKWADEIKKQLPELPVERRRRFVGEYGLPAGDVEVLICNPEFSEYFEQVSSELGEWAKNSEPKIDPKKAVKLAVNYLTTETPRIANSLQVADYKLAEKITPENFAEFIKCVAQNVVSSSAAQTVLAEMFQTGADPSHIIKEKDLAQVSNEEELAEKINQVLEENSSAVEQYKKGKQNSLMFLVGKVMAASRGKANPQVVTEMLKERLT